MTLPNPVGYPAKGLHDWEDELKAYIDGVEPNKGLTVRMVNGAGNPGGVVTYWPQDNPMFVQINKARSDTRLLFELSVSAYHESPGVPVLWNVEIRRGADDALVASVQTIKAAINPANTHLTFSGNSASAAGLAAGPYNLRVAVQNNASTGLVKCDTNDTQSLVVTETYLATG